MKLVREQITKVYDIEYEDFKKLLKIDMDTNILSVSTVFSGPNKKISCIEIITEKARGNGTSKNIDE